MDTVFWFLVGMVFGWILVQAGIQIERKTSINRWDWTPEKEELFQASLKSHIKAHEELEKRE